MLATFMAEDGVQLRGARVLELGSDTGMLAMACAVRGAKVRRASTCMRSVSVHVRNAWALSCKDDVSTHVYWNARCARRSSRDPPSTPRKASASPTRPCTPGFTRSNHNVVIENERADVKAATRNAVDRQRCGSHLFLHRLGRPERVPGIWNCQEPTFRPERRSRPAKPTAPRRPPRRANTRVRASWTHQGLLGPSQLNRDAQSARNRRPGTAPAT